MKVTACRRPKFGPAPKLNLVSGSGPRVKKQPVWYDSRLKSKVNYAPS